LLHYIQDTITNPVTEVTRLLNFLHIYLYIHRNHKYIKKFKEKMKEFLGKICTKIPSSLEGECKEFVDIYGDAVVALIVQEIDPSQVNIFLYLKC